MKLRFPNGMHNVKQTTLEIYIRHHDISEPSALKESTRDNDDGVLPADVVKEPYQNRSNSDKAKEENSGQSREIFVAADIQITPKDKDRGKPVDTIPIPGKPIDIQSILNSAHRIAEDMGQSYPDAKEALPTLMDRPVLPKLAMILETKKTVAGAMEYADGMIKVVTESGSTYCMQSKISPLTNVPQDGPVKAEGITMTCP